MSYARSTSIESAVELAAQEFCLRPCKTRRPECGDAVSKSLDWERVIEFRLWKNYAVTTQSGSGFGPKLPGEWIGPKLELDDLTCCSFAAFNVLRCPRGIGGPEAFAFPS